MAAIPATLDFRNNFRKFIYKLPRYFLLSFESTDFLVQEKKGAKRFSDGSHLAFKIGTILATFDPQVAPITQIKFPVHWLFGSGDKAHIHFQDGSHASHFEASKF